MLYAQPNGCAFQPDVLLDGCISDGLPTHVGLIRGQAPSAAWRSREAGVMTDSASNLSLTKPPVASTGMLIRKPVAEVFAAFVDPAITSKFWFTKASGKL